jgi:glycosyltransferase involved in cell wall biosynthesis
MVKNQKNDVPLISIVIPSFNQGQFIEQTITSVLGQIYPNLELIIIDGGSTDQTLEIIDKYSDLISYFISEPDQGQAHAINKGFRVAQGEILAWLNSDDIYLPCTLSKVAKILGASREPKLLHGGCLHFYESQTITYGRLASDFDVEQLTYYDHVVQPSAFWSRSLWEAVGELNENYHYVLDWDWFIRASQICKFISIKEYLSIYRLHENHKSSGGGLKRTDEVLKIVETYASEDWILAYRDVYKHIEILKIIRENLVKFKLYRFRQLFYPNLYLKYGNHRLDIALSMML